MKTRRIFAVCRREIFKIMETKQSLVEWIKKEGKMYNTRPMMISHKNWEKNCFNFNGKQFSIVFKRFSNKKNRCGVSSDRHHTENVSVCFHVWKKCALKIMTWSKIYRVPTNRRDREKKTHQRTCALWIFHRNSSSYQSKWILIKWILLSSFLFLSSFYQGIKKNATKENKEWTENNDDDDDDDGNSNEQAL